jgi:hypothetical protein
MYHQSDNHSPETSRTGSTETKELENPSIAEAVLWHQERSS